MAATIPCCHQVFNHVDIDAIVGTPPTFCVTCSQRWRECDFQVPGGVVNIRDGKIALIEEKLTYKFSVSAGIHMLSPQTLVHMLDDEFLDMPTPFENLAAKGDNAISFLIRECWLDVGRMGAYKKANSGSSGVFG